MEGGPLTLDEAERCRADKIKGLKVHTETVAFYYYGRVAYGNDGSLEFPANDKDVPLEIEGFTRDTENPRVFRSRWPECVQRVTCLAVHEGRLEITATCNSHLSGRFFEPVTTDVCGACEVCHKYPKARDTTQDRRGLYRPCRRKGPRLDEGPPGRRHFRAGRRKHKGVASRTS